MLPSWLVTGKISGFFFFFLTNPKADLSLDGLWLFRMSSRILELFSNFYLIDSSSSFTLNCMVSSASFSDSRILFLSYSLRSSSTFLAYISWGSKWLMIRFDCLFFFLHFSSSSRALTSLSLSSTSPSTCVTIWGLSI